MVNTQRAYFMQWHQNLQQKYLVFLFQWQRKPVNNGAQDLQQFRHAIMPLRLVNEAVENVVDLFTNKGSKTQKFPINPVKCCLQKIPFAWILGIE